MPEMETAAVIDDREKEIEMRCRIAILIGTLSLLLPAMVGPLAAGMDQKEALAEHYHLSKPESGGPYPVAVLVPGCSGFSAGFAKMHYDSVQQRLVDLGFLTIRVDYLAVRNAQSCTAVGMEQVAGDIAWVIADLRRSPLVKKGAINVLGWSWGGATALRALIGHDNREAISVDSVAVFYPACKYISGRWESPVPVLVLHGAIDTVAPLSECRALFKTLPASTRLTLRVLDNAHHGFDIAQLPAEFHYRFGTLGSNPQAAEKAWVDLTAFLHR